MINIFLWKQQFQTQPLDLYLTLWRLTNLTKKTMKLSLVVSFRNSTKIARQTKTNHVQLTNKTSLLTYFQFSFVALSFVCFVSIKCCVFIWDTLLDWHSSCHLDSGCSWYIGIFTGLIGWTGLWRRFLINVILIIH